MSSTTSPAPSNSPDLSPDPDPHRAPPDRFREVSHLRDPDGLILVVTERVDSGHLSWCIFREWEDTRGQPPRRGAYLSAHHIAGAGRLMAQLAIDLPLLKDQARARLRARTAR
mgnify:CR=1 FL=1